MQIEHFIKTASIAQVLNAIRHTSKELDFGLGMLAIFDSLDPNLECVVEKKIGLADTRVSLILDSAKGSVAESPGIAVLTRNQIKSQNGSP